MNPNINILIMAIFSLVSGLAIYIWLVRTNARFFYSTNVISWLLIALFPVLLIFSFFPETTFFSTIETISMGGAIGAFIFIWIYGTKIAKQAGEVDIRIEEIRGELQSREDEIRDLRERLDERVPTVLRKSEIFDYMLKGRRGKRIALITGDIRAVKVADIWINSENTNMQMSRYYENSISGIIRYLGAIKDITGNVIEDVIADELAQVMGHNLIVQPATVLVTGAGKLQETHNVKKIFHVASVHGEIGCGYHPINNIEMCITNSLIRADSAEFKSLNLKSILFPLMGTGTAKGNLKEISERLIQATDFYMETIKNSTIESVYFLTLTDVELETCKAIMDASEKLISSI